jgi:hypothetical protein
MPRVRQFGVKAGHKQMEVQVKLWLQGGHKWEFCCDEEDPILFGLISALSGDLGDKLSSDGLIQLQTRTGERLFLTPSSLVSVSVLPITDELQLLDANRLIGLSDGLSRPAAFAVVPNALPPETHQVLIKHALAQEASAQQQENGVLRVSLSPLEEALTRSFRSHVDKSRVELGIPETQTAHIEFELFAVGDGKSIALDSEANGSLVLVYHFHKQPKAFKGGGVRLFDVPVEKNANRAANSFRDFEIEDNGVLIFPRAVISAGLPVYCATRAFADGLFVLRGYVRQELASE